MAWAGWVCCWRHLSWNYACWSRSLSTGYRGCSGWPRTCCCSAASSSVNACWAASLLPAAVGACESLLCAFWSSLASRPPWICLCFCRSAAIDLAPSFLRSAGFLVVFKKEYSGFGGGASLGLSARTRYKFTVAPSGFVWTGWAYSTYFPSSTVSFRRFLSWPFAASSRCSGLCLHCISTNNQRTTK